MGTVQEISSNNQFGQGSNSHLMSGSTLEVESCDTEKDRFPNFPINLSRALSTKDRLIP